MSSDPSRTCRSTAAGSTLSSARRCSSTVKTRPGCGRAQPRHCSRRARSCLDARRTGLPSLPTRLLAVDARGPSPALQSECGVGGGRRTTRRWHRCVPRDAARHLRRDRVSARPCVEARARARLAVEPRRAGSGSAGVDSPRASAGCTVRKPACHCDRARQRIGIRRCQGACQPPRGRGRWSRA